MRTSILYVHHAIGMGGACNSLAILISSLNPDKFQSTVLMPKREGNESVKELFVSVGAEVIEETHIRPFNGVNGCRCDSLADRTYAILSAIPTLWAVRKHVRRIKPDIVHLNTSVLPFAAAGARLAGRSVPVVTHVRETLLTNWWGRGLGWLNRRFVTFFIGIDQNGLNKIGASRDQSKVISNSVDRTVYRPGHYDGSAFRKQFNCTEDEVLFLSLARVARSNGSLEFAHLLAQHKDRLPANARFVICGFPEQPSDYANKTLDAISQNDNVYSLEFTSDVLALLESSDVIVAPFTEPHSARMVIEGSAMNKPCLVTNLENLIEQIEPDVSGFVFDLDSVDDFIRKVVVLCNDHQLRKRMGIAAGEFAANRYDAGANADRVAKVYRQLLDAKQ